MEMEKNCGCHEESMACVECGTPVLERVNYYDGQFLVARDLSDEQRFLVGKQREHAHRLHGWGTVCGLKVTPHPDPACLDRFVVIEPGLALDCCGREIHVPEKVYVDVRAELAAAAPPGPDDKTLLISLCYDECRTEYAPALYSDCACEEDRCEPSRVRETFEVKLQMAKAVPSPPGRDLAGVRLDRSSTLNYSKAVRMAYDAHLSRIYVLNANTPSQIAVYDADSECLLGSIDVGAQALDLAASPDGKTLYVVIHAAGPPEGNKLRALNVADLSAVNPAGTDQPAGDGALDPAKPPRVVCSSTRIFVLNAVSRQVFIFDTSPAVAPFATFDKTEDFRDIAVTADGAWLFVAAPAHVWAAKVSTLTGTPSVTAIAVADDPTSVAVSGDGARLFAATAAKTVRLFRIQETPSPFPEVGSGVPVTDPAVSIAASPSGEWLYVLGSAAGKSVIRVVDADKLDSNPAGAVGNPVAVEGTPEQVVLDPSGHWLYAVFASVAGQPCSGVAVFRLTERDCEEILWKALDGCPECDDPSCLVLAAVRNFTLGQPITETRIDNRVRRLAPSTSSLRELIECCCASGGEAGAKGPRGDKGDPGDAGTIAVGTVTTGAPGSSAQVTNVGTPSAAILNFTIPQGPPGSSGVAATVQVGTVTTGAPGSSAVVHNSGTSSAAILDFTIPRGDKGDAAGSECCEEGLTRITALSWKHDAATPLATVQQDPAVIVQFSGAGISVPDPVAAARVFRVEMVDQSQGPFRCFCELQGSVIPVRNLKFAGGVITSADRFPGAPPAKANALAFVFPENARPLLDKSGAEVRVTLLGDLILDAAEKRRAVDAEFVRAELPTGDHPAGAASGIQGGTFHSWFWLGKRPDK